MTEGQVFGDFSDDRMREQLAGFVAGKHEEDKPEQPGGGAKQNIREQGKDRSTELLMEAMADPKTDPEAVLQQAKESKLLVRNEKGYQSKGERGEHILDAYSERLKFESEKTTTPETEEAVPSLQQQLDTINNRIRDLESPSAVSKALSEGYDKDRIVLLDTYKRQQSELIAKMESGKATERENETVAPTEEEPARVEPETPEEVQPEVAEAEQPPVAEKHTAVNIEEAVEKFMKSGSGGIGEALYSKIDELSGAQVPLKRGFLDRAYLAVFKNEEYKGYREGWEKYNNQQEELKSLKTEERIWAKKEQKLVAEYSRHQEKIQELVSKEEAGEITKSEWRELQKITNKLALMRENINSLYLKGLAEKIGYEGALPGSAWEGIKEDEKFGDKERAEKEELIRGLLDGSISSKFTELLPENQTRFLNEQGGEALRNLAQVRALQVHLRELLRTEMEDTSVAKNPQTIFQLTNALRESDFQEKCAEKAVEQQIRSYKTAEFFEKLGQDGKKILKETFNLVVADAGSDFEINYDTTLRDIILNGQSKTAGIISGYMQSNNIVALLNNRGQKAWSDFFVFYQKGMEKYVPSRTKSAQEIEKLQGRISELEVKKDELRRSIKEIAVLRAMVAATKEDEARDERAGKEFDRLMKEAEKENNLRDEEIKAIWDNLMDEATREDNIRTIIHGAIEDLAPTKTREQELKKSFKENGLSEKFQDDFQYFCQMQVLMASRETKKLEGQLREEKERLETIDAQINKAEGRLAEEYSEEQQDSWEKKEKELEQALKMATQREETVRDGLEEKIKKLREAAEKSLAARLRNGLKGV